MKTLDVAPRPSVESRGDLFTGCFQYFPSPLSPEGNSLHLLTFLTDVHCADGEQTVVRCKGGVVDAVCVVLGWSPALCAC